MMENTEIDYSDGLSLIRSRRRLRWLELPGFVLIMLIVQYLFPNSIVVSAIAVLIFAVIAIRYNFKVSSIECPRCKNPFGKNGWFIQSFNQKCLHCDLSIYADKQKSVS